MNVSKINSYNIPISFKSMSGNNATCILRNDTSWRRASQYFGDFFKNYDKVNFEVWGCSDASEVWSWILVLKKYLPDSWKKFMKIKASDKDARMINRAKNSPCKLDYTDVSCLKGITDNNYFDYFYREESQDMHYRFAATPKPILKDNVIFEVATIEDNAKMLDSNIPNIISCKNAMIYMPKMLVEDTIKTLSEKNGEPLLLSIGDYDVEYGIKEILEKHGFRESSEVWNIYEKAD